MGLDGNGQRIAERTADRLSDVKLRAIYTSPIERTRETAEIVARPHGLEPVIEDGLIEVDYGTWSGRTLKSLYRLKAWRTVQITPSRMVFPEGESLADAQRRAVATCERLADRHLNDTIALVSHSDVIQSIVSHYLGQPLDMFTRIVISAGSVSVIDLPRQGIASVVAVNGTGAEGSWR